MIVKVDPQSKSIDFFISHASEDKDEFVREFVNRLLKLGYLTFYDEYSIKLGDSIVEKLNEGISNSQVFIIVISPNFLKKKWTNKEFNTIFSLSTQLGKRLIPVYHNIDYESVLLHYPLLNEIKGINTSVGMDLLCSEVVNQSGVEPNLGFIISKEAENIVSESGFCLIFSFIIPRLYNPDQNKCLFELGEIERKHSRLSIYIVDDNRLCFKLTTSDYKEIVLSTELPMLPDDTSFFLSIELSVKQKLLKMMINEEIVSEINFVELDLSKFASSKSMYIIGGTLEFNNPCPFTIQMNIMAKPDSVDILKIQDAFSSYIKGLKTLDKAQ